MYRFCLHLCPGSGPYKGLRLHFDVQLPDIWPARPPKVRSSVSINHPNVFGSWICCDLLEVHQPAAGYTGGYTPALTLCGLFMQFLTFFSSEKIEQEYGYWVSLGDAWVQTVIEVNEQFITLRKRNWLWESTCANSSRFKCKKCSYGIYVSHLVGGDPNPHTLEKGQTIGTGADPGFVRSLIPNE